MQKLGILANTFLKLMSVYYLKQFYPTRKYEQTQNYRDPNARFKENFIIFSPVELPRKLRLINRFLQNKERKTSRGRNDRSKSR